MDLCAWLERFRGHARGARPSAVAAGFVAAGVLLSGCAAGAPAPTPSATASPMPSMSTPPGGVSLEELGFQHGPASLVSLPAGVRIGQRIDQSNVVTLTFHEPAPPQIADWLRTHLPQAGFTIVGDAGDALVFRGHGWTGAYAPGTGVETGLSIRKDASG